VNSARFHDPAATGTRSLEIEKSRRGRMNSVKHADRNRDDRRIPELNPEIPQEIMLLVKHDVEIVQRRMRGP